jgi:uncharacterized protein YaiI (UPF0178 family)
MRIPHGPRLTLEIVEQGFDAADEWIVTHAVRNDLVITGDVPLAARCIEKGARALGPTGHSFTEANIGDALATRNLMAEMRSAGRELVRPAPFDPRDRSRFLEALDREIQSLRSVRTPGDGSGRAREA